MEVHSLEEIETMFRLIGLATEADRQRFSFATAPTAGETPHIFIQADAWTASDEENRRAQLA